MEYHNTKNPKACKPYQNSQTEQSKTHWCKAASGNHRAELKIKCIYLCSECWMTFISFPSNFEVQWSWLLKDFCTCSSGSLLASVHIKIQLQWSYCSLEKVAFSTSKHKVWIKSHSLNPLTPEIWFWILPSSSCMFPC